MSKYSEIKWTCRSQIKSVCQENKFVIVKIGATWCKPCKRCAPHVEECYAKMPKGLIMIKVDADEGNDILAYLKVRSIPFLQSYVRGEPQHVCGSSKPEDISAFFQKVASGMALDKRWRDKVKWSDGGDD